MAQGRPRLIREIEEKSAAIVAAFLPGMQGGTAIAEVLAGEVNPSGKLPITYPRHPNDLTLYDHKFSEQASEHQAYKPQFPFGFGLSYTTFAYSDLALDKTKLKPGEALTVSVTVKNTGTRAGQEIVQLYLTDLYASITPHNQRLKRFEKIPLAPGESKSVTFTLQPQDFAFIGRDHQPTIEAGEFKVAVGPLAQQFTLE